MEKGFLYLSLLLFSLNVSGQGLEFDLSQYVLPEIEYRTGRLYFDWNGYGSGQQNENDFFGSSDHTAHRLKSSLAWSGSYFRNSRDWQIERYHSLTFAPSFVFDKRNDNNNLGSNNTLVRTFRSQASLSTAATYRHFHRPQRFVQFETALYSSAIYEKNHTESDGDLYDEIDKGFNGELDLGLLYGIGRVENVVHASHALRILADLQRLSLIKEIPDKTQIMELSDFLAQRDYTRVFDSRIKYMQDLELLSEKLNDLGIVKERSTLFYASINDMFLEGVDFNRRAGQSFVFGLSGHLDPSLNSPLSVFDKFEYGAGFKTAYEYHKPLNLSWQFDFSAGLTSLYVIWEYLDDSFEEPDKLIHLMANTEIEFSWYPDTRTEWHAALNGQIGNRPLLYLSQSNELLEKDLQFTISLYNGLFYYLSPRSWLIARAEVGYNLFNFSYLSQPLPNTTEYRKWNYNTSIGFGYYLY